MFERFTKDARAVVTGAQELARENGSRSLDTRHVVVAMLDRPGPVRRALRATGCDTDALAAAGRSALRAGGLDADALAALGIDLDAVRRQADAVFGEGALERAARRPTSGHLPVAPDAKKALQLALREAIRLQDRRIEDTHLMLGVLRAACPGRALLTDAGVETDALRAALEGRAAA
jgi:ATP-dependent Clp protease ATP-binding subunit ClpA